MWLRVHQLDRGRTKQARNETVVPEVLCYGIPSAYKNEAQRPHVGDRLTVRTWAGRHRIEFCRALTCGLFDLSIRMGFKTPA
jgi:hypothetical protein